MDIILRRHAKAAGLNKYFTNRPCKSGHVSERYVDSGVCMACLYANVDRYRETNKAVVYAKTALWRRSNPSYNKDYYAANSAKSQHHTKEWKHRNPDRVALMVDRRGAILKKATPSWFESEKVRELYKKRDELSLAWGIDLTVDHIIPLQGDSVCGLHCWANLQLITRDLNGQKHTQYEQDW